MSDLKDKFVVITGAARADGIGMATAVSLRDRGARVLATDILEAQGPGDRQVGIDYRKLDVTSDDDWRAITQFLREAGGLTGFSKTPPATFEGHGRDDTRRIRTVDQDHQICTFLGLQHSAPILRENGGGSIVNMSSTAGPRGSVRSFAYSSTKWTVRGMTKAAALDLKPSGIRVNSVFREPIVNCILAERCPSSGRRPIWTAAPTSPMPGVERNIASGWRGRSRP